MNHEVKPDKAVIVFEDGTTKEYDDFVVVANTPECDAQLFFNADAVTLGQAIQMLSFAYTDQLAKLPAETADDVREALRAFIDLEEAV